MISKELLSEVVGLCCGVKSIRNSEVVYWFNCIGEVRESSINIYELALKCKDYCCFSFGIKLYSEVRKRDSRCCISKNRDGEMINKQIIGKTEPEAIFKAAEWVLRFKGIK